MCNSRYHIVGVIRRTVIILYMILGSMVGIISRIVGITVGMLGITVGIVSLIVGAVLDIIVGTDV